MTEPSACAHVRRRRNCMILRTMITMITVVIFTSGAQAEKTKAISAKPQSAITNFAEKSTSRTSLQTTKTVKAVAPKQAGKKSTAKHSKKVRTATVRPQSRVAKQATARKARASKVAVAARSKAKTATKRTKVRKHTSAARSSVANSGKKTSLNETASIDTDGIGARRAKYLPVADTLRPTGLPITLIDAVITRESRYDPKARGSRGEVGLMQILPSTGRALARENGFTSVADLSASGFVDWLEIPENNVKLGTIYLNMCHDKAKKSVAATIGCYNAGPGNMWAWESITYTRNYVSFVNAHMAAN
ncbi:lytic transglycosylase domain-containing protein [Rhodoligotrophos appendicifer]|uniref:lytic transglycosylase domain-containing protein n=1 Tax=Rhodoligotrophos appendicifer TaxID=987056 RepID=UPI001FE2F9DA|nr:lytic transglycosylase domain-containing protein [Rhodoligotrophos appendicifer]